jgi:diguanylate cyclase (GGDEF)-like protein
VTGGSSGLPLDFAERLRIGQAGLRRALSRRQALEDAVREAYADTDPPRIARMLVERAAAWMPADTWAVFVSDGADQLTLLHALNHGAADTASLLGVASWVIAQRRDFLSAGLRGDDRVRSDADGTVIALPLAGHGLWSAALVGFDRRPSARVPSFAAGVRPALDSLLGVMALALDHALLIRQAEALSVTDDLTGLHNSRYLRDALHREAKRATRYGRPLSVLFIDLDGFKSVNDTHGHLCGSRAIVEAATLIGRCARESDVVARYGGDEFVVVLPDTPSEGAVVVARRVRDRIAAFPFLESLHLDVRLTASVGISTLPDTTVVPDDLLRAADQAMYRVKERGKNNYCLASQI